MKYRNLTASMLRYVDPPSPACVQLQRSGCWIVAKCCKIQYCPLYLKYDFLTQSCCSPCPPHTVDNKAEQAQELILQMTFFFSLPLSFTVTIAMWLQDIWLLHRELMLRTKEQCSLKGLLMGHSSAVYSLKITICQHLLTARTTSQALFIVLRRCFSGPVPRAG